MKAKEGLCFLLNFPHSLPMTPEKGGDNGDGDGDNGDGDGDYGDDVDDSLPKCQ